MSDMSAVIQPKSDQINADDLIGGDLTIRITDVSVSPGQEQPVSMKFEGSPKVFRPCKSMARVMVAAWGPDSKAYVGRSLQLYRDPTVKWGGMEVGGIRIRAMTDMPNSRPMTMALTATKGQRKPYTVNPLTVQAAAIGVTMTAADAYALAKAEAGKGTASFRAWFGSEAGKAARLAESRIAVGTTTMAELQAIASGADNLGPRMDADPFGASDTATLPAPSDDEIQRQIADDHAREMARLDEQP